MHVAALILRFAEKRFQVKDRKTLPPAGPAPTNLPPGGRRNHTAHVSAKKARALTVTLTRSILFTLLILLQATRSKLQHALRGRWGYYILHLNKQRSVSFSSYLSFQYILCSTQR